MVLGIPVVSTTTKPFFEAIATTLFSMKVSLNTMTRWLIFLIWTGMSSVDLAQTGKMIKIRDKPIKSDL
jgi:hypothetical protein